MFGDKEGIVSGGRGRTDGAPEADILGAVAGGVDLGGRVPVLGKRAQASVIGI